MDKSDVLMIVSQFQKTIELKGIRINKIILFGSYVTEVQREGSDIDLVVISEDFNDMGYWERIEMLSDAIYELFEPIEAIAMTPEEWENANSFVVDYAKNGEMVYG